MKKVVAAVVSGALVLSVSGIMSIAADVQNEAALTAVVQEITEQGYSINVAGNELQILKDGKIISFYRMESVRIRIVRSGEGGIAIQFTDDKGKATKISLGDQKTVSISGKLDEVVIAKDVPSTVQVALTKEAKVESVKVQAPVSLTMEGGSEVERLNVTDKNASVDVAKSADVGKVTTVNKKAVSGVSSNKIETTKEKDTAVIVKEKDKDFYVPGSPVVVNPDGTEKPDPKPEPTPDPNPNPDPTPETTKTVTSLAELKEALQDSNIKTINISGDVRIDEAIDCSGITINVPSSATFRVGADMLSGDNVSVNVESGGKMSGYWNVKPGTTVTANPGADLFWVITDDSNPEQIKKTESSLVGPNGYIQNEGKVVIKGADPAKSPAGYDIEIDGNATIKAQKEETGKTEDTAPLLVAGFELVIKDGSTVTVAGGKTTKGDSTVVVTDGSYKDGAGKIVLEGNAKLEIKDDAQIRLDGGQDSISKGSGTISKDNGSLIKKDGTELTDDEIAALRAAQALAAQTPAADAAIPATETKAPEKSEGAPEVTESEKKPEEAAKDDKASEEKDPAADADKTTETKDPAAEAGKTEDAKEPAKEADKDTETKDPAAETDKSTETKDPVKRLTRLQRRKTL